MLKTQNILTPQDLTHGLFVPTIVFVRETDDFHTRLCVFNYFSEYFPEVKTGATIHMWFFDSSGTVVGHQDIRLDYRGQLQFELAELGVHFEGTAGMSLVPDSLPNFIKQDTVGTGYYVYYYDDQGHADFSHEWEQMHFTPMHSPPWICVVRPLSFPDTRLIVMNGYYGPDQEAGTARYTARLRNQQGVVLAEKMMPPLPPRGSTHIPLQELFPELLDLAGREKAVAVEVEGSNIQGPFTWVTIPSGDFNIHHFC